MGSAKGSEAAVQVLRLMPLFILLHLHLFFFLKFSFLFFGKSTRRSPLLRIATAIVWDAYRLADLLGRPPLGRWRRASRLLSASCNIL